MILPCPCDIQTHILLTANCSPDALSQGDLPSNWDSINTPYCGVSYPGLLSNISSCCADNQQVQVANDCWHYCTPIGNTSTEQSTNWVNCLREVWQGEDSEWKESMGTSCNKASEEGTSTGVRVGIAGWKAAGSLAVVLLVTLL